MARAADIRVEVIYALPGEQRLIEVVLPDGATVSDAIRHSGLCGRYPALEAGQTSVGIFGRRAALNTVLRDGDRVEIYRPLSADPKEARRKRSALRKTNAG